MKTHTKSMLEILTETVAYYAEDPKGRRSYTTNLPRRPCLLVGDTGDPIGRCMLPDAIVHGSVWSKVVHVAPHELSIPALEIVNLDEILRPEYRGHPVGFWSLLQYYLHASDQVWGADGGLTEDGEFCVNQLTEVIARYNNGDDPGLRHPYWLHDRLRDARRKALGILNEDGTRSKAII